MGKDPNCPICKLEFGIFRHRYPCAVCQGSFCDDCTPNKYVVPPNTSAESVCTRCEANLSSKIKTKDGGHRLGNGGANQGNPDEREERARAAELRAQKQRGGTTHSKPPARGAVEPSQPNRAEKESNDLEAQGVPSGGRVLGGASESEQPMNPVLAAALKREQQAKRPDASPQMDPERKKLLAEIQAVLRQREEEEPFGLRALDATKMRIFLRDLTARGK
ncbi:Hypothetical protein, putative [Bodo saltans]|uniref:FYVE-type domain-containing protein n=1 Tax=Bodo saltans TaxID=75058 RepID=A0A0S4JVE6_BODSA|nr:Hypothetical protein, putative [Bodo saltans]|eukprot:CUG93391.1 Hypothetical protein, putative [Bodo saltans]